MKKKNTVILLSCLFIIVAGICYSCTYNNGQETLTTSLDSEKNNEDLSVVTDKKTDFVTDSNDNGNDNVRSDENPGLIYVHICGAVENPDVYQIKAGSRLVELIELAGGLKTDAAGDYINQAMVVEDGQRIYIPTRQELENLAISEYIQGDQSSQAANTETKTKVNINTADESTLMSLPGIGQAKAKSIIDYRNKNGNFSDIRDLMKVPGIKEGLFSKIADQVTVGN